MSGATKLSDRQQLARCRAVALLRVSAELREISGPETPREERARLALILEDVELAETRARGEIDPICPDCGVDLGIPNTFDEQCADCQRIEAEAIEGARRLNEEAKRAAS